MTTASISLSSGISGSQQNVIPNSKASQTEKGLISIFKRSAGKVGTDDTHAFGKNIKIGNGEKFLKVSPEDLLYSCEMTLESNKRPLQIELPSSLFKQARQGNNIHFIRNGVEYNLLLSPNYRIVDFKKRIEEASPFAECENCVKENSKSSLAEFLYDQDIPGSYYIWCQQGIFAIILSPKTKRISLDQKGTIPLNYDELSAFTSYCVPEFCHDESSRGHIILVKAWGPGPQFNILLDRNYLYVDLKFNPPDSEDNFICSDTIAKGHLLLNRVIIPEEGQIIDEENISATMNEVTRYLKVVIPFKQSVQEEETIACSSTSSTSTIQLQPEATLSPAPKTKILVRCDVGCPNKLYLRGEGAPFLSWDKGLEMLMIQAPDLWALEFDQAGFDHLKYKVLMNDDIQFWEKGDNHEIKLGQQQETTATF